MEYLLGSLTTAVSFFILTKILQNRLVHYLPGKINISQSRTHSMVGHLILNIPEQKPLKTQATDHFDKAHVRVVLLENMAYWIQDSELLCAEIIDGQVDSNSTKKVDTMALDDVELNKVILVVEKLTEGKTNDSGYSGNS